MIEKNCYDIIGTNQYAIKYDIRTKEERTEEEKDRFIKEKYEHELKRINHKLENCETYEEMQKLERLKKEIAEAYQKIKNPISRDIYNRAIEEPVEIKRKMINIEERNFYKDLRTSSETLKYRSDEENDIALKERRDKLVEHYQEMLPKATSFGEKQKISFEILRVDEAYRNLSNRHKRDRYQLELNEQTRKRNIKRTYSHVSEYTPDLILSKRDSKGNILKEKMIARRKVENPIERAYVDYANRNLRVSKTAKINFRNLGFEQSFYEYEVKRNINGEEKSDIVYTDLSTIELSYNKKTGKLFNPEYYDCVVNQLFSEDCLEGAKLNGGYIGLVLKNKEGKYYTTINNKKLSQTEREMLSAVMILNQQKINREKEGETR